MRLRSIVSVASTSIILAGVLSGTAVFAAAPSSVFVSTKHCSDTGPGTSPKPFCTVQEGVNAVAAGGTVHIEKGTYTEQVVIGSGKNDIKLFGSGATIAAPAVMTASKAIVQVSGATGVTLRDLTVSGPGGGGCDSLEYGIRIDNAGQANINDVHVTKIEDSPFSGCQNGVGIQVGRSSENTTGSATITDTKVDNYQKNGITVSGTGSSATIVDSTVIGAGPTSVNGQNGIQISSGATATLRDNIIKNNVYTPQTVSATGILLFQPGVVTLTDNVVNNNDTDIYLLGVKNSTFKDNVTNNASFNGIYADTDSAGNTFTNNEAHGTVVGAGNYDMQDDSIGTGTLGTANTWHNNDCKTSSPEKLCKQ